jgi:rhodanese-related sulfurtransferase
MKAFLFFVLSIAGISVFAQSRQLGSDTIRTNVTVTQAKTIVDTNDFNPDFVILDVRTPSEFATVHIANAINVDYNDVNFSAELDALDHNKMYLLHCASGGRSTPTFAMMQTKHFREVYHMNNGLNAWIAAGYPTVSGSTFTENYPVPERNSINTNNEGNLLRIFYAGEKTRKMIVYDLQGKVMLCKPLEYGDQQVDISTLAQGLYVVSIQSPDVSMIKKIYVR